MFFFFFCSLLSSCSRRLVQFYGNSTITIAAYPRKSFSYLAYLAVMRIRFPSFQIPLLLNAVFFYCVVSAIQFSIRTLGAGRGQMKTIKCMYAIWQDSPTSVIHCSHHEIRKDLYREYNIIV
jgi:hypothetical protein